MTGRPQAVVADGFPARLDEVRGRIAASSLDPASVRVIAVTKGFGVEAAQLALAAGLTDLGENYADELVDKVVQLEHGPDAEGAVWHFLGAVQRNKVARLAPLVSWWQGIRRVEEGRTIAARHPGSHVLVQMDLTGLPGRGGCPPDVVPDLVAALRDEDLVVEGLMTVGPPGPPEHSRAGFALLSSMADALDLPVRSMGMSDDLDVALSEGSTMVRVGRALFGDRPPVVPADPTRAAGPDKP
jgi:PLP dependent protein